MAEDPSAIPAATIRDVDLSRIAPELAAEIQRLGFLMERGQETEEQFAELICLLDSAGFRNKGEYLLRRNINVVADGAALYHKLYGTEKPDEFAAAIAAFSTQFSVALRLTKERGFLAQDFDSVPRSDPHRTLSILDQHCEVRISFADEKWIEADVCSDGDDYVILRWSTGRWAVVGH